MLNLERAAAIDFIAANPDAGIFLGGGLRKMRIPGAGDSKPISAGTGFGGLSKEAPYNAIGANPLITLTKSASMASPLP